MVKKIRNIKIPEEWGWISQNGIMSPITTLKAPAPHHLLKCITCSCVKGCGKNCGCRKAGIKCSIMCGFYKGQSCTNAMAIELDEIEDNEIINLEEENEEDRTFDDDDQMM